MRKCSLAIILILLILPLLAYGWGLVPTGGEISSEADPLGCDGCGTANLTFCWHGEDPNLLDEDPVGCSLEDTTASVVGDIAIVGSKIWVNAAQSYYTFDSDADADENFLVAVPEAGSIEFKCNIQHWDDNAEFFKIYDSSNFVFVSMHGGSDSDIEARIRANDGTNLPIATTTAGNKTENTDLRIRAMWQEDIIPYVWIEIANFDGSNAATASDDDPNYNWTMLDGEWIYFGNATANDPNYSMWDIKLYDTWMGWDA